MHRRLRSSAATFAAAAALTIGVAACGSDSKSADTTEATVDTTEDTTNDTEAPDTTDASDTTAATTTARPATTIGRSTTTAESDETTTTGKSTGTTTDDTVVDSGAVPDGWVAYTSDPGDYVAAFPEEPSEQTQNAPLPDGSTLALVIVSAQDGNVFFGTARGEYSAGSIVDTAASLQGAEDQAIKNVNGTLTSSTDITLQGRPGRQFSASVTSGGQQGTLVQRVFLDGDTIYQNIVVGPGTIAPDDDQVAAFFASFEFTS